MGPSVALTPSVVYDDGTALYDEDQMRLVWSVLFDRYPPMPPGHTLEPTPADAYFAQGPAMFEVGVPESDLARQWRCAWLRTAADAAAKGDAARLAEAETKLTLEAYKALPGIDPAKAEELWETMTGSGKNLGIHDRQFELQYDC